MKGKNEALKILLESGITKELGDSELTFKIAEAFATTCQALEDANELIERLKKSLDNEAKMRHNMDRILNGDVPCFDCDC